MVEDIAMFVQSVATEGKHVCFLAEFRSPISVSTTFEIQYAPKTNKKLLSILLTGALSH